MTQSDAESSTNARARQERGTMLWREILDALREDIASERYPAGTRLPTEAALAQRFGVNRHTVRRALQVMREAGQIHVRRGSGAVVIEGRFDYRLSERTRFSTNLASWGRTPSREILRLETVRGSEIETQQLELPSGSLVVLAEFVASANDVPISYSRSVFPASRLPGFSAALARERSVTSALAACGVPDYQRRSTRLTAERPGSTVARHLKIPEDTPVLLSENLNIAPDGHPVEYGHTWFCSARVAVVVDRTSFGPISEEDGGSIAHAEGMDTGSDST